MYDLLAGVKTVFSVVFVINYKFFTATKLKMSRYISISVTTVSKNLFILFKHHAIHFPAS